MERTPTQPAGRALPTRSSPSQARPRTSRGTFQPTRTPVSAAVVEARAALARLDERAQRDAHRADGNWQALAECQGADLDDFYAVTSYRGERAELATVVAKTYCARCPVVAECLRMAVSTKDRHAVLGGTTPAERGMAPMRESAPKTSQPSG